MRHPTRATRGHSGRRVAHRFSVIRTPAEHQSGHHDHQQRKQRKQLLAIDKLAQRRPGESTDDSRPGEEAGDAPFHRAGACMIQEVDPRISGYGQCAGADREMCIGYTDEIDNQWHRKHRATTADEPKRKSNQRPCTATKDILQHRQVHRLSSPVIAVTFSSIRAGSHSHSRPRSMHFQ